VKRILAVLIVVVVLLGVWLSEFAHRSAPATIGSQSVVADSHDRDDEIDAPIAAVKGAAVERSSLGARAPEPPTTSTVSPDRVTVRSSIGLELPFAEIEREPKEWTQIAIEQGTCARSALVGASSVRAPGHVAVAVVPDAKEIVLEPDALLVLHADGLRTCVRTIDPDDQYTDHSLGENKNMRPELRRGIAWGWLSDTEWALAVSPSSLEEAYRGGIELYLHWRDERMLSVQFDGKPGCRERWEVPCDLRIPGSPLRVHVKRPPGFERGALLIGLSRFKPIGTPGWDQTFDWGRVHGWDDDDFSQRQHIEAGLSDASFPFAPTGVTLSVSALDDSSGAYGRVEFIHDGSDRELVLRPPFRMRGRFASSLPGHGIAHVDVTCAFFDGSRSVYGWGIEARAIVPAPDGSFEVHGTEWLPQTPDVPLDPPPTVSIQVESPGFERADLTFETQGAPIVDCGVITLIPRAGEIVLAPGHGLLPKSVQWEDVATIGTPLFFWTIRDARILEDGALEIVLRRDEEKPELLEVSPGDRMAWPDPPPDRCLIHVLFDGGDESRAFGRDEHGRFRAVPTLERDIDLDCRELPPGQQWQVGWAWKGLFTVCSASESGKVVHSKVRAPADGATLYWSKSGDPPRTADADGGSQPFDTVHAPIVLR
jgi:hypothetical protein